MSLTPGVGAGGEGTLQQMLLLLDPRRKRSLLEIQSPHDVNHLFNCPSNTTDLSPIDLWHRPKMAAAFLNPHEVDDDDNQPGSSG